MSTLIRTLAPLETILCLSRLKMKNKLCGRCLGAVWLKAIAPDGWFADGAVTFEDIIDEKAGHEVTPKMVDEAVRFITETLASSDDAKKSAYVRESKI